MKLRVVTAFLVALGATFVIAGPASAQTGDVNCPDLQTPAEVWAAFPPGDPNRLDADNDGLPCEDQFGEAAIRAARPASAADPAPAASNDDSQTPVGGVQTGFGGTADNGGLPWAPALLGSLIVLGLAVPAARLRRA